MKFQDSAADEGCCQSHSHFAATGALLGRAYLPMPGLLGTDDQPLTRNLRVSP